MAELVDISTLRGPKEVITAALVGLAKWTGGFRYSKPFIYFTGVVGIRVFVDHASGRTDDYGQALCDYIRANDLGTVFDGIPTGENWTRNQIKIWVWQPNWDTIRKLHAAPATVPATEIVPDQRPTEYLVR